MLSTPTPQALVCPRLKNYFQGLTARAADTENMALRTAFGRFFIDLSIFQNIFFRPKNHQKYNFKRVQAQQKIEPKKNGSNKNSKKHVFSKIDVEAF